MKIKLTFEKASVCYVFVFLVVKTCFTSTAVISFASCIRESWTFSKLARVNIAVYEVFTWRAFT